MKVVDVVVVAVLDVVVVVVMSELSIAQLLTLT